MKRLLLFLFPAVILWACNNDTANTETSAASDSAATADNAAPLNLPYTVEKTPDWERGDNAHIAPAMNALRAFEMNDMNALKGHLADSVEFYGDNMRFTGSKDSLVKIIGGYRSSIAAVKIEMRDYESVSSKTRGENWVGLWYKETTTDKGGKIDSTMTMDDVKIVNGKVALIDSKIRHLAKQ